MNKILKFLSIILIGFSLEVAYAMDQKPADDLVPLNNGQCISKKEVARVYAILKKLYETSDESHHALCLLHGICVSGFDVVQIDKQFPAVIQILKDYGLIVEDSVPKVVANIVKSSIEATVVEDEFLGNNKYIFIKLIDPTIAKKLAWGCNIL